MRIGVLSFNQTDGRPWRFISCKDRDYYLSVGTHIKISKRLIKEKDPSTIEQKVVTVSSSPERHYVPHIQVVKVTPAALNPPLPSYDCVAAPYPVRDMSSYALRNMREIWGADQETWQRLVGLDE